MATDCDAVDVHDDDKGCNNDDDEDGDKGFAMVMAMFFVCGCML